MRLNRLFGNANPIASSHVCPITEWSVGEGSCFFSAFRIGWLSGSILPTYSGSKLSGDGF